MSFYEAQFSDQGTLVAIAATDLARLLSLCDDGLFSGAVGPNTLC